MSALRRTNRTLRATALLLIGALAVHWLRYLLAYGSTATNELHRQGHTYLIDLVPVLASIAGALLVAAGLLRLALPQRSRRSRPWLARSCGAYALALLLVYSAQELSEGLIAPGHPSGVTGLLVDGGWLVVPLAVTFGVVLAVSDRIFEAVEIRACALLCLKSPARLQGTGDGRPQMPWLRPLAASTLAFGLARRPPPRSVYRST